MLPHGDGGFPQLRRVTQSSRKISVLVPVRAQARNDVGRAIDIANRAPDRYAQRSRLGDFFLMLTRVFQHGLNR
jgi:hypothetical protein